MARGQSVRGLRALARPRDGRRARAGTQRVQALQVKVVVVVLVGGLGDVVGAEGGVHVEVVVAAVEGVRVPQAGGTLLGGNSMEWCWITYYITACLNL